MCGIAGVLTGARGPTPDFAELRRMAAMLTHRGPDGYGLYRDDRIGLAHCRLSLIDLKTGAQPLTNEDGSVWLSFNGEIFNYIELRRKLIELGYRFTTTGDSEVIVHCYSAFGERAWEMLNGQFAFALWDRRQRRLWLVRDRVGILPLFYTRGPDFIAFASEMKALFHGGRVQPRLDPAALGEIFVNWSTIPPRSPFRDVLQVRPATALAIDHDLRITEHRYWIADPHAAPQAPPTVEAAAEALDAALEKSVALRLRADVPVGAYISGGLDSSVSSSIARERVSALETFGICFDDPRYNETREQRLVSQYLGTRHHELVCSAEAIVDGLAETIWHCETPILRTSPVPLYLLSGLVRESGIKTVLTGEGADEFLCGYSIFKETKIRAAWARQPESQCRPALLRRVHPYISRREDRANALWLNFFRRGLSDVANPFYSHLIRWNNTAWTLRLLAPEIRRGFALEPMLAAIDANLPTGWRDWEVVMRAQMIEIEAFMSSFLLACQGDRVAMAHGVEGRYPFLDPDVIDFCLGLPLRYKLRGLRDKLVLRRLAQRRLPAEIWQRQKMPFRAPIASVLTSAANRVDEFISFGSDDLGDGLLDETTIKNLRSRWRTFQDTLPSEREEMGMVGVITLGMLTRAFGREFADRARAATERLAASPCHVFVDRAA